MRVARSDCFIWFFGLESKRVFVMDNEQQQAIKDKTFVFDYVFNEYQDTRTVYQQSIQHVLDNLINGYNSTIFAYGQTGAGKTYTLFGQEYENLETSFPDGQNENSQGIVFQVVNDLFQKISKMGDKEFAIKISYLEIYNEKIIDLLQSKDQ